MLNIVVKMKVMMMVSMIVRLLRLLLYDGVFDDVCDYVIGGEGSGKVTDFKLFGGFAFRQTNGRMDIWGCRVAFATEKIMNRFFIFPNQKL